MEFQKLHDGSDCNCIDNAEEDVVNQYVRRLRKEKLSEKDFKTHWERGIGVNKNECGDICSYKGISLNQLSEESESLIIQKYKTTFNINPKKGGHLIKFQLKDDAGVVEHSPTKSDETHYSFFKSDDFELEKLDIKETVKFA